MYGHRSDQEVGARSGCEAGIQGAVRIDTRHARPCGAIEVGEVAHADHFAIGLHCHLRYCVVECRAGGETRIEAAITVDPRNAPPSCPIVVQELPTYVDVAAAGQGHAVHLVVRTSAGGEGNITRAIALHPRYTVDPRAVVSGEVAADDDHAIVLHNGAGDPRVRTCAHIEVAIERALCAYTRDREQNARDQQCAEEVGACHVECVVFVIR